MSTCAYVGVSVDSMGVEVVGHRMWVRLIVFYVLGERGGVQGTW